MDTDECLLRPSVGVVVAVVGLNPSSSLLLVLLDVVSVMGPRATAANGAVSEVVDDLRSDRESILSFVRALDVEPAVSWYVVLGWEGIGIVLGETSRDAGGLLTVAMLVMVCRCEESRTSKVKQGQEQGKGLVYTSYLIYWQHLWSCWVV